MRLKVLGTAILSMSLVSTVVSAEASATFSKKYDLPQQVLVTVKGKLLSKRKLDCQVNTESEKGNNFTFVSTKKTNIINGIIIQEGQNSSLFAHPGDHINIEMDARARLGITNLDQGAASLNCK